MAPLSIRNCLLVAGVAALIALGFTRAAPGADDDEDKPPLQVGMLASFYVDVPDAAAKTSTDSFKKLMRKEVGRRGETHTIADPFDMAQRLQDGKLQMAVFHGFEYAWVRRKYDGIKPLTLAFNEKTKFRCCVMVKKDSPAKAVGDLKGKQLAVPAQSREESRLFIGTLCAKDGGAVKFFDKVTKPANLEDALDDVVDDVVQATVIDAVALSRYEKRKPARFEKLRKLAESDIFPASVIVYRAGKVDDATLQRIREALRGAGDSAEGKQMLFTWKVSGFEEIPDWYEKSLDDIAKAFPPPAKGDDKK